MRRFISLVAILLLVLSLCSACKPGQTAGNDPGENTAASNSTEGNADQLGQFKTVDLSGKVYDYTLFQKNKLTMVNVWTTWCGYCVEEIPTLQKLSEEYSGKGFAVVGILGDSVTAYDNPVRDDNAIAEGLKILRQSGAQYLVLQPDAVLCKVLAGIDGYPTTFFVDGSGKIVYKITGANDYEGWKKLIDQLLEQVGK